MCDKLDLGAYAFDVYFKNELTASVVISSDRKNVEYKKYTDKLLRVPFSFDNPTVEQMYEFLESRCMDKKREQLQEYLRDLELDEYNPYEIVKRTHGVMWEDFLWLKFPGEKITWEDVSVRD